MTMTKYYAYILKCADKNGKITYYTGYTSNFKRRLLQHYNKTGAKYTKSREIVSWCYFTFSTRSEALKEEKRIKKLSHTEKEEILEGVIEDDGCWDWEICEELEDRGYW